MVKTYFQWDIHNPFLPRRALEATFFYGSSNGMPWKVTFHPTDRGIDYWQFSLTLSYDEKFELPKQAVTLRNLSIVIRQGTNIIGSKEEDFFTLEDRNNFRYVYGTKNQIDSQEEPYHFVICINFDLWLIFTPERYVYGTEYFDDQDLRMLSHNLRRLLTTGENSNKMIVSGGEVEEVRKVHSSILDERWNNFPADDIVRVYISTNLLSKILTYMYSGDNTFSSDAQNITELFQVIDHYQLRHLYKIFVPEVLQQQRVTRIPVFIKACLFPLDIISERSANGVSLEWHFQQEERGPVSGSLIRYEIHFQLRVGYAARNWLSYSLESKSSSRIYVDVNLEFVRSKDKEDPEQDTSKVSVEKEFCIDGRDLPMDPGETMESGPVLFMACLDTFGIPPEAKNEFFIRCFLNVNNGEMVEQIRSLDGLEPEQELQRQGILGDHDFHRQQELERHSVLSDHLRNVYEKKDSPKMILVDQARNLYEERFDAKMHVIYKFEYVYSMGMIERIHREIWEARIPLWSKAMKDPPESNPAVWKCVLSHNALDVVLEYIYTGKTLCEKLRVRPCCLDEIQKFAMITNFLSLNDLVRRYRSR